MFNGIRNTQNSFLFQGGTRTQRKQSKSMYDPAINDEKVKFNNNRKKASEKKITPKQAKAMGEVQEVMNTPEGQHHITK